MIANFQLVVTGHSLGAGTASVLAFLLRRLYPDTVCYAYSPPGCVFNAAAAEASREFVTSVTFGKGWDQMGHFPNKRDILFNRRGPRLQTLDHVRDGAQDQDEEGSSEVQTAQISGKDFLIS